MRFQELTISALTGLIPALVWLLFWIREDRKHPEPKKLLALTFFAGMISILPALWLEQIARQYITGTMLIVWWSLIEELIKFAFAYFIILRRKDVDEPIDYIIYMVTIALGFAAAENTCFVFFGLGSLDSFGLQSLWTGNVRFIGATLLHVVTSSAIGISMALTFYKNEARKRQYLAIGLILAIALHAAFNLTIMSNDGKGGLTASVLVWIGVIIVLLLFERVKKVHPTNNYS